MEIILYKGPIFREIFSEFNEAQINNNKRLIKLLDVSYTVGEIKPKIKIEEKKISIQISKSAIKNHSTLYKEMLELAKNGELKKSRFIAEQLILDDCTTAEVFSFYGQMLHRQGENEEAIKNLKYAIKWKAESYYALRKLAQIYLQQKDLKRASLYFNEAIRVKPDQIGDINDFAGILLKSGHLDEAFHYFNKTLEIQSDFAPAMFGKALLFQYQEDYLKAFEMAIQCLQHTEENNKTLINNTFKLIDDIFKEYSERIDFELTENLKQQLPNKVRFLKDDALKVEAKLDLSDDERPHQIRYRTSNPAYSYFLLREIIRLQFLLEATAVKENKQVAESEESFKLFCKYCQPAQKNMMKGGVQKERLPHLLKAFFEGLTAQLLDFPLQLFIEQYIYKNYPSLRPLQFVALLKILKQNALTASDKQLNAITPLFVRNANISMIYAQLFHFKGLYTIDLTSILKNKTLAHTGQQLYEFYLQMKDDRQAGEEYDLSEWWAEELRLDKFFQLRKIQYP
ncbi:tetratricopeptide repeat protein [Xanthovirga aplysinae]|uniref:tetratricopeptide repeat protein n=1 Tax=Xanthovirga aplysinae TaxID=2529853 RepID=UPI0012BD4412|nr:tetratricopeptide repeat protein [Xanthovirga aplysinae]MTI30368.1 hypothetical protein [Xanthovirga aplysinae]